MLLLSSIRAIYIFGVDSLTHLFNLLTHLFNSLTHLFSHWHSYSITDILIQFTDILIQFPNTLIPGQTDYNPFEDLTSAYYMEQSNKWGLVHINTYVLVVDTHECDHGAKRTVQQVIVLVYACVDVRLPSHTWVLTRFEARKRMWVVTCIVTVMWVVTCMSCMEPCRSIRCLTARTCVHVHTSLYTQTHMNKYHA